jgi:geranylgeranyl diphosphate synthase type I
MLRRKTAILLGFAAEAGAMIALGTTDPEEPRVRALREFAIDAGLAFQLRDDWLGLYGDPATLGKPVGSDLRAGKRTWLFARGLARLDGPARARLAAAIGDATLSDTAVGGIATLLRDCGAEAEVADLARARIDRALARLDALTAGPARDRLADFARYLYDRDR